MEKQFGLKDILLLICMLPFLWTAVSPLFHPGLFPTIDNISVIRLYEMANELKSGQLPVRYVSNLSRGRGYMLFHFYAPMPFYTGATMHLLGVNLVGALKRTYLIGFLILFLGMYGLVKQFFGRLAGLTAAFLSIYSPFVGYDVYWRGGLGEFWALAFIPGVFWMVYRSAKFHRPLDSVIGAFVLAGVILSHNLTSYMLIPYLLTWCIFWMIKERHYSYVLLLLIGGLGLSAFFWLPLIIEKQYMWVSYLTIDQKDILGGLLGKDFIHAVTPTFVPIMIHWFYMFIPFLSIAVLLFKRKIHKTDKSVFIIIITIYFSVSLMMASVLSEPLWKNLKSILSVFQFPWRYYVMSTLFGAVLFGVLPFLFSRKISVIAAILLMISGYTIVRPNFIPQRYEFVDIYRPEDPCGTSWGVEYLPVWVKTCLINPATHNVHPISGNMSVDILKDAPREIRASVIAEKTGILRIEKYYYPGWMVKIDGHKSQASYDNLYGLIDVEIKEGQHDIKVYWENTNLWNVSNIISLVSIFSLGSILIFYKKKFT